MGDIAGWFTQFSREALEGDNRALLGLALTGIFVGFALTRRKLSGWMLVPIIAGAIWYGLIRLPRSGIRVAFRPRGCRFGTYITVSSRRA